MGTRSIVAESLHQHVYAAHKTPLHVTKKHHAPTSMVDTTPAPPPCVPAIIPHARITAMVLWDDSAWPGNKVGCMAYEGAVMVGRVALGLVMPACGGGG